MSKTESVHPRGDSDEFDIKSDTSEIKFDPVQRSMTRDIISSLSPNKVFPLALGYTTTITSTVGAIINTVIPDSSAFSANNFASLANVFDEYRLVGMTVIIESFNKYSKTTTSSGPVYMVHDDLDQTALTSAALAADYGTCHFSNTDDWFPSHRGIRFSKSASETTNLWQPTSATTIVGSLKFWSTAVTASITYATVLIRYDVEFRLLV